MLSAPHRGVAESDLNIWIKHEATLRQLYIQENKPRKEVKSIMESVYGFPEMSLSIYETRLKNLLKLKKNMKQSEWQAIDARLKARGDKATEVLLNGEVMPQRKVLKETRRNRDTSIVSSHYSKVYLLLARPLPDNIEIRTPRSASPVSVDRPVLEARNGDDRNYNLNSGRIAIPSTPHFPRPFVTSENFIPPALSSISPSSGPMTLAPETNPIISNLLLSGSTASLQHPTNFDPTYELDPIGENLSSLATFPLTEWLDPTHTTCPTLNYTAAALWSTLSDSPFSKLVQNLILIRNDPSVPTSIFEFNTGLNVSNGLDSNILVTQPVQSISMDYGALCIFPSPWHENTSFGRLISAQAATQPRQPPGHVSRNFDMFSSLQALVSLAASPGNQFKKISDWLNLQIEWFSTSQLTMMLRCVLQSRGTLAPRAIWEIIIQIIGTIKDVKLFETVFDIGHKMGWVHEFRQICLMLALEIDSIDIAKQLLDNGASLFENPQYHTSTWRLLPLERDALSIAARKCNPTALQLIIKAGANVNFRNRVSYHPLYAIICAKELESLRLECAKLLLDAGADASQHLRIRLVYLRPGQPIMDVLGSELSLIEWAYVFAPQFYSLLHQYFASRVHLLAVDSIMIAAGQGVTSLRNYLSVTPYPRGEYRAVLLEKSLLLSALSTRHDRLSIVESLLDVDVHPDATGLHRYLKSQGPYSKLSEASCSIIANILENTSNDYFDEDSVLISKLLEYGATLNCREILGNLTKGNAAKGQVLQFLLAKGADMKAHGSVALLYAALNNDFESVWLLCQHGASILDRVGSLTVFELAVLQNTSSRWEQTILREFPRRSVTVNMFEFLTKFGADESWLRNPEFIFNFLSNSEGLQQRVKILLEAGLDVNMPLPNSTVLERCLRSKSEELNVVALCKLLVSKGAKLSPELSTGRACNLFVPLIELNLDLRFAEDLISAGADVQSRYVSEDRHEDRDAKTPLQAACSINRLDIVKLLVSNGAMVNDAVQDEITPLMHACMAGGDDALELISYLISKGANVNAECGVPHGDVSRLTRATEAAAQAGDVAIMIQLLNSGAILNSEWLIAEHPLELDWAAMEGHLQMVHLLLRSGARSHFRGTSGYDGAIQLAEEYTNFAVAELIREYARFLAPDVILRQDY